jgi:hypothetical protein
MCNVDRLGRRSERESPKYCDCFQWFLPFVAAEGRLVMGIMGCVGDKVVPMTQVPFAFGSCAGGNTGFRIWGHGTFHNYGGSFFLSFLNVMQIIC